LRLLSAESWIVLGDEEWITLEELGRRGQLATAGAEGDGGVSASEDDHDSDSDSESNPCGNDADTVMGFASRVDRPAPASCGRSVSEAPFGLSAEDTPSAALATAAAASGAAQEACALALAQALSYAAAGARQHAAERALSALRQLALGSGSVGPAAAPSFLQAQARVSTAAAQKVYSAVRLLGRLGEIAAVCCRAERAAVGARRSLAEARARAVEQQGALVGLEIDFVLAP
jgi:hypothetical protein